jgi:UDP-N-acetyl-L-fucosamine synthase
MIVGLNPERILQGLVQLKYQHTGTETQPFNPSTLQPSQPLNRNFRPVGDYTMPNVSDKVVRIIIGYTDYIKRTVWSEE